jgi:peptide deformylase
MKMDLYKVLTFPDPFLKTIAKPVTEFNDDLREISERMIHTMYENSGIGLAAVQVGIDKRLFVMDVNYSKDLPEEERNPEVIINLEFIKKSDEQISEEGCLSVPEFRAEIHRYGRVKVRYQDLKGETTEKEVEGILAICMQHENDHLDGKLFIDHLPPLQRSMVRKRLKKMNS